MIEQTIDVKGMSCDHCKRAVEAALIELDGVKRVEVDLTEGTVTVSFTPEQTSITQMVAAIEGQGYDVN
ncbi:copper chaperone CopZ [Mechercharimyces sp. CAU 1602]|uniref:copper chaperone CopZ n=1 Tax=Mechercharimyces sp. CAU 1602 TaxID=2973933 RepID=UPI002163BAEB|nr:copper chaperone CopZ [Mechercharimyces sp. CAU 1602]MCS1350596.1 copper chaperone CopZ [Mechercharimyces sp. CAU 1602]